MISNDRIPSHILKYMVSSYLDYRDHFNLHCTSKALKKLFYEMITHVGIEQRYFEELMLWNRGRGLETLRELTHHLPQLQRLDVVTNYALTRKVKFNKVHETVSRTLLSSSSTSSAPGPVPSVSDNPSMRMPICTPHDGLLDTSKIPEGGCTEAEAVAKHETSLVSTSAPTQAATTPLNSRMEMPNSNHEEGCVGNSMHVEESDSDAEKGSDMDEPTNPFDGRKGLLQPFQETVKADDVLSRLEFGEPGKVNFFTINLKLLKLKPDHEHIVNAKFWLKALQQLGYYKEFSGENNDNEQPAFSEFYCLSLIHDGLQALDKAGINPKNVKVLDHEQFSRVISHSAWKELSATMINQLFVIFSESQADLQMTIENFFVACLWMDQLNLPHDTSCPPLDLVLDHLHRLITLNEKVRKCFKVCSSSVATSQLIGGPNSIDGAFLRTGESSFTINIYGGMKFITRQVKVSHLDRDHIQHGTLHEYFMTDTRVELIFAIGGVKEKFRLRGTPRSPLTQLMDSIKSVPINRSRSR